MLKVQKFMRTAFGYASIVSSAVFLALSPELLTAPLPHLTSRFHAGPVSLLLIAVREIMLVMPAVLAISSGLAWWALRKGLRPARSRALAASVASLVMSTPFLAAGIAIQLYSLAGPVEVTGVLVLFATLLSLGITGLVAFRKPIASLAEPVQAHHASDLQTIGMLAPTA